ncbi:MAG: hypothetical protein KIS76_11390 [Pyrinomonadaceae bacterium]|nr:hypothetical protein [Pyrinomonadaceae bacterium]
MEKKNTAEIVFVASSFAMLLLFTAAFIYYIVYKEILIVLVGLGFAAFVAGFIAKNRWDAGKKD